MADIISKANRSRNMSQIPNKNTKPELKVRSLLHRKGYRFRLHQRDLPGRPDIVMRRHHTVIFVNGCFWHRHENCQFAYTPKSRVDFWTEKFQKNVDRDKQNYKQLYELNWKVIVVWECELRDESSLWTRLEAELKQS